MIFSRGFKGRRQDGPPDRVPPGQYLTDDFPVLSAGPTPHTPLEEWTFSIEGGAEPVSWTWDEFRRFRARRSRRTSTASRSGRSSTRSGRASRSTRCSDQVEHDAEYVLAFCDGGYTTNLPLEDVTGGKAWVGIRLRRRAARARARRARAAARAAPLLLEEREVGARPQPPRRGRARLLGDERLPPARRSVAGTAVLGRLTWLAAEVAGGRWETPRVRTLELEVPGWPGHRAGQHLDVRLTAEDGYQAERSYSIASAPGELLAVTVERLEDGEVSPYLVDEAREGDALRGARPDRRLLRLGARRPRAGAARRRRLGRRAADVDGASPRPRPEAARRCGCSTRRARSRT